MRTTIVDGAPIVGGGGPSLSAQAREELQLRGQIIDLWIENRRLEHELHLRQQSNPDRSRRVAASLGDPVSLAEFWAENCPRPAWIDPRHNVSVVDGVTIIGGNGRPLSADVREQGRLRKQIAELWFDNKQLEQRLQLYRDFNAHHEPPGSPEGGRFAEAGVHLANSRSRGGGGPRRIGGAVVEPTPAQAARLEATGNLARRAIDEADEVLGRGLGKDLARVPYPEDLRFRAEPSVVGADAESRIAENEAITRQARAERQRREALAFDPAPGKAREAEMRSALRLERQLPLTFTRSSGAGEDYVDNLERTWDFIGSGVNDFIFNRPGNAENFFRRLEGKLYNRAAEMIGVDVSELGPGNANRVLDYISTMPTVYQPRVVIIRKK